MPLHRRHLLLSVSLCLLQATSAWALDRGNPEEARALLGKAVAHVRAIGADKALPDFSDAKGRFVDRDLYVTAYDMNGRCLAHGGNPRSIGRDNLNLQDAEGKFLIRERLEIARAKGRGSQDYKFLNPVSRAIEPKTMLFEKIGEVVLAVGFYTP